MEEVKSFVTISEKTYEGLVRESERYKMIKNAFLCCVHKTTYGVTFNDSYMLSVLASACQEEYNNWYDSVPDNEE